MHLFIVFCWSLILITIFVLSSSISFICNKLYFRKRKIKKKCFIIIMTIFMLINIFAINLYANKPVLICSEVYEKYISEELKTEIYKYNSGLYSKSLPIFPLYIEILSADSDSVSIRTQYYPLGSIQMNIGPNGVKSIDKPLY